MHVTEMPGSCQFRNSDYDYDMYDYDYHYDYDYADEDKEQCLLICLQKLQTIPHAVGCYFQKITGQCIFLKTGTIVGSSGSDSDRFSIRQAQHSGSASDSDTCWKFDEGEFLYGLICLH